jgi:hypothetical protein
MYLIPKLDVVTSQPASVQEVRRYDTVVAPAVSTSQVRVVN